MAAFFIASLSIIGIPPVGGTWSKWFLLIGTMETQQWVIMAVLLISSLLNIAYLLPIPIRAFFPGDDKTSSDGSKAIAITEAPMASLIAIGITTAGCVVLFLYPQPLYELATAILETSSGVKP
jgi:multicomponent Na+:H+ antiporter subunit D